MAGIARMFGIGLVFVIASIGWLVLGGVTSERSTNPRGAMRGEVESLWGSAQTQAAPTLAFSWQTEREVKRLETTATGTREIVETVIDDHSEALIPDASDVDVALGSDLRRRGLHWYSLYDVDFGATYRYRHERTERGFVTVDFPLPDARGMYDGLVFTVNGVDHARALSAEGNSLRARVPVGPGDALEIVARYASRGLEAWRYVPAPGVARLEHFTLDLRTDFGDIDFPDGAMSPSTRARRSDGGWDLGWHFTSVVTGHHIGVVTPTRIQPGELATALSFSAPVSLFFFFLVVFVLATIRRIDLHPINYFFVAGAFFAFHLLFAYSADHLAVETAFALSSVVSVALVVSYLRLAVSTKFAFREAAAAQLVYLVGFSLAHFWEGFTGLTVTILAILTLFLLMQLTGKTRWSEVLSAKRVGPPVVAPGT